MRTSLSPETPFCVFYAAKGRRAQGTGHDAAWPLAAQHLLPYIKTGELDRTV